MNPLLTSLCQRKCKLILAHNGWWRNTTVPLYHAGVFCLSYPLAPIPFQRLFYPIYPLKFHPPRLQVFKELKIWYLFVTFVKFRRLPFSETTRIIWDIQFYFYYIWTTVELLLLLLLIIIWGNRYVPRKVIIGIHNWVELIVNTWNPKKKFYKNRDGRSKIHIYWRWVHVVQNK